MAAMQSAPSTLGAARRGLFLDCAEGKERGKEVKLVTASLGGLFHFHQTYDVAYWQILLQKSQIAER
jgi:hypothetical protein